MGDIRPFDPFAATSAELADYVALRSAATSVDNPEDPPPTYDAMVGRLRITLAVGGATRFWAAYRGGHLVGIARLTLPMQDNAGLAFLHVGVHPAVRRQGVATELVRALLPAVEAAGRAVVICAGLRTDSAAARWAAALGFAVVQRTVLQWLPVPEVPPATWDVPVPDGYRLARWTGAAPDELVEPYAAARPAIQDAPAGGASYQEMAWTVDRVRAKERELAEENVSERVVVAIHADTAAVAGVTGVLRYPFRREFAYQNDTSVVAAHRGHGLGVAMKAAMMRWLLADCPELERVITTTAAANSYMINVNLALGYRTVRTMVWTEIDRSELAARLASLSVTH